jgi:hypothetical protein
MNLSKPRKHPEAHLKSADYNRALANLTEAQANITRLDGELLKLDMAGLDLEREHIALTVDLLCVAQAAVAQLRQARAADSIPEEGNADLLHGKDWVTFRTAGSYLGRTRRAIEIAAKKGSLTAQGCGQNRRISVESLVKYLPPSKSAK